MSKSMRDEGTVAAEGLPLDSLADIAARLAQRPYAKRGAPAADTVIRVLLVDDHTIVRAGLHALLNAVPDIKVVGQASDGAEAESMVEQLRPDIVVMDLDMPGTGGIAATRRLAAMESSPRVLVLTMTSEEAGLVQALEAGASGYLMKDAAERDLVEAIRAVWGNEIYVRPRVARLLASRLRPSAVATDVNEAAASLEKLSGRERTVLRLVAEGYNGPEIGRKLGVTAKTVDTYKQRIESKLGMRHRSEYVRFALTAGLLKQ